MTITLGVLTVLLLTVATGFFVAMEFTYVAVDRNLLSSLADRGDDTARRALRVTERLSFTLSGAQFGITVTALLVGYVSEPLLGEGLAELLGGTGLSAAARLSVGLLTALIFSTVVQMVIGELAPKNLSIARNLPLSRALARPTLVYLAVAGPVIKLFDGASTRLLRAVGIEPIEELEHGATAQDLARIIDASASGGAIEEDLSAMLERGLSFRERTVREVMTPRVDVRTLRPDMTIAELVDQTGSGHARFPVIGDDGDEILGIVGPDIVLTVPADRRSRTPLAAVLGADLARAVVVPETLSLARALEYLRTERRQLAAVIDEYGGFAGVISFEDIAEEVVGDILDEDDRDTPASIENPDGSWTLPARIRLDELATQHDMELPEDEDFETLGGLVLARLGRTARVGDRIEVEVLPSRDELLDGDADRSPRVAAVEVLQVRRRVPESVRLSLVAAAGPETGAEAEAGAGIPEVTA